MPGQAVTFHNRKSLRTCPANDEVLSSSGHFDVWLWLVFLNGFFELGVC
jgi:hypothetical protein